MPELPEVETVRRGLENNFGKTIQSVEVKYPKMIQTDLDTFRQDLPGQEIRAMGRRGNISCFIWRIWSSSRICGMEGSISFIQTRFLFASMPMSFHFTDGSTLVYEDVRSLGPWKSSYLSLSTAIFGEKIGPEPTEADFKGPAFQAALKKSKKPIKSALLDQKLVAGLGNIYVDEVLIEPRFIQPVWVKAWLLEKPK